MEQEKNSWQLKRYDALLFDFDGTLFDTADLNYRAYRLAYFDLGIEITPEMFSHTGGLSVYQFNSAMGVSCDVEKLRALKAKYYREFNIYARPNRYLVDLIRESKKKKALVTTARQMNVMPLLMKYGLVDLFDVMIFQEDVSAHKPDPEAYLVALQRLEIDAERCLVFEDSREGIVAARRAGMDCIQIRKFQDDCLIDVTGGSDAKTKIYLEHDSLVVEKTASGEGSVRLKNQADFLSSQRGEYFVPILSTGWKDGENEFWYRMPYVMGTNLFDYQNKIKMLPLVVHRLWEASRQTRAHRNTEVGVRDEIQSRYIDPGIEIYNRYAEEKVENLSLSSDVDFDEYLVSDYHGDSTFENIIIQRDENIVFIDPVPDRNVVKGLLQDFSKLGQSLYGYEAIREYKSFDYRVERQIFDELCRKYLLDSEYASLKAHIACMFLRRLRHQEYQDPNLVPIYGKIAIDLIREFNEGNYSLQQ